MALKAPHRKVIADDLNFRCSSTASEGMAVCYSSTAGYVEKSTSADSKNVAGLIMTNVENRGIPVDLPVLGDDIGTADLPRNYNKNVTYTSGYVRLLKIGTVETDQIVSGDSPSQGDACYLGANGKLSTSVSGATLINRPLLGHWLSAKDSNSFAKVWINITSAGHIDYTEAHDRAERN